MRALAVPSLLLTLIAATSPVLATGASHPHAPCGTAAIPPPDLTALRPASVARTARQAEYAVGDKETIWVWNFATEEAEQIACTYRAANEHSYVLVADAVWSLSGITASDVSRISEVFEQNSGPSPGIGAGVYQTLTERFAPVEPVYMNATSPVRSDSMVFIAIVSIGSDLEDAYVSGYVSGRDRENVSWSNYRNMVYLEALRSGDSQREETLSHEFLHVIHVATDPSEQRWVDEGIAVYSQTICGYPGNSGNEYFKNPAVGLFNENSLPSLADYDKAFLIMQYLADHFGDDLISEVLTSTAHGITSVDAALGQLGHTERFGTDVFPAWAVANISAPQSGTPYAYLTYNPLVHQPSSFGDVGALSVELNGLLEPWGVRYIHPTANVADGMQGTMTSVATDIDWSVMSVEGDGNEPYGVRDWYAVTNRIYRDCTTDSPWIVVFPRGSVNGSDLGYSFDLHPPNTGLDAQIVSRDPEPDATNVLPQLAQISAEFANVDIGWNVEVTVSGQVSGVLNRDVAVTRADREGMCGATVTVADLSTDNLPENDLITVTVNGLVGPDGVTIPSSEISWQFRTGAEDHTAPQVTVGVLPNPIVPERVTVMLISDEDLYPDPASPDAVQVVVDGTRVVALDNPDGSRRRWTGTFGVGQTGAYVLTVSAADVVGNSVASPALTYVVSDDGGSVSARVARTEEADE